MSKERVRIVDIADELGLSTATVSNVIHGKTKKISDETVKRVQQLLEERQYIPSMAGILLARNNSKIIGVIINKHEKYEKRVLQDPFIMASIDYLSEEIEKAGYVMMLKATADCNEIIEFASMWNMEGVVVIGFCGEDYEKLKNQMHIPLVVYDGYFDSTLGYANVAIDDHDGGYQMGKYLIEQGHKRILCISDNNICMDQERYLGLQQAALEWENIEVSQMLIPMKKHMRMDFYQSQWREFLNYSAIFAVSDFYAIELMQFLQGKGVRIPDDLSIAGFDDIPLCELTVPRLTTVHQDACKRAQSALSLLQELKDGTCSARSKILSVSLVERESVKKQRK